MQVISCTSAFVLVAICGLLLRSLTLVSGARSPNFEVLDPNIESSSVSSELMPIIVLIIILFTVPIITAIILAIYSNSKFKKLAKKARQKALESKAHVKIRMSHAFLGKKDDSFSSEHRRRSQSNASPREVAIRFSPDVLSSEDRSIQSFTPSAAGATSSSHNQPLNTILLPSSETGNQNFSPIQPEHLSSDEDFHFCDFEALGN
jgi:hypothetical protein